jgi:UDP-4-amino-4,6-dideoxy-N-acetyl-beta-L-altrosamine transaminase
VKSKYISYGRQCIEEDDIRAVTEVLKSDFLTQGPKVKEFEESLSAYCGSKYAVVFSSGTAALLGAYFAAGLGSGDEIITSPITFMATANAALLLDAKPVFVDVEPTTGNIDAKLIEGVITEKTKLVVPVHFGGHPVELDVIFEIAKKNKLMVIEDACHALGAKYLNNRIGNCRYSDMSVFSFHPVKSITTGEGGAVLTNNESFYERLNVFRHHGITNVQTTFKNNDMIWGQWYHEMQYLGGNYRLTDIHCALGISQLKKLERFIQERKRIVAKYANAFSGNRFFDLPIEKEGFESAWHLYSIRLKDSYKADKTDIFASLRQRGVGVQVHYIPVYLQPYYRQLGYKKGLCPNAEDFYEREISIPLYPTMSDDDIDYVIKTLIGVFEKD